MRLARFKRTHAYIRLRRGRLARELAGGRKRRAPGSAQQVRTARVAAARAALAGGALRTDVPLDGAIEYLRRALRTS
jgi:hypothetical protein